MAVLRLRDRKSTRLNSSHSQISYAVFCLKKKKKNHETLIQVEPKHLLSSPPIKFLLRRCDHPYVHAHRFVLAHLLQLAALQIFFFNDTATTEIYTLSLHDALPI